MSVRAKIRPYHILPFSLFLLSHSVHTLHARTNRRKDMKEEREREKRVREIVFQMRYGRSLFLSLSLFVKQAKQCGNGR